MALYNDSTTFRLALWAVEQIPGVTSAPTGYYPLQGKIATLVGPGTTIHTNQATIAGQLYKDDTATPGTVVAGIWAQFTGGFFSDKCPMWIIEPGWSIVFVGAGSSAAVGGGFFWEQLDACAFPVDREYYDLIIQASQ